MNTYWYMWKLYVCVSVQAYMHVCIAFVTEWCAGTLLKHTNTHTMIGRTSRWLTNRVEAFCRSTLSFAAFTSSLLKLVNIKSEKLDVERIINEWVRPHGFRLSSSVSSYCLYYYKLPVRVVWIMNNCRPREIKSSMKTDAVPIEWAVVRRENRWEKLHENKSAVLS